MADFFEKLSIGGTFKLIVLALGMIWGFSYFGKQLGWISDSFQVAGGFVIVGVLLAIFLAYAFIHKTLQFDKEMVLPIVLSLAVIGALIYFGINPLPGMFSIGETQIRAGLQSIIGGLN